MVSTRFETSRRREVAVLLESQVNQAREDRGPRGIAFVGAALNSHPEGGRLLDFQPEI